MTAVIMSWILEMIGVVRNVWITEVILHTVATTDIFISSLSTTVKKHRGLKNKNKKSTVGWKLKLLLTAQTQIHYTWDWRRIRCANGRYPQRRYFVYVQYCAHRPHSLSLIVNTVETWSSALLYLRIRTDCVVLEGLKKQGTAVIVIWWSKWASAEGRLQGEDGDKKNR